MPSAHSQSADHDQCKSGYFKIDAVRALGYPESFIRMWEFYLCYCEGGFEERAISDVHMLLAHPRNRRALPAAG